MLTLDHRPPLMSERCLMPADRSAEPDRTEKPLTITEQARRAQFIGVTIDLVAQHGYAGTSLARIAEAAGVSKAAVLYHFPSKDAVVQAAYTTVIDGLVAQVGAAVEACSGAAALETYLRSLIGYLHDHPPHARMIVEAMAGAGGTTDRPDAPSRRQTVADLIDSAKAAGHYRGDVDSASAAVIINGAVDALVSQRLQDPGIDLAGAADKLVDLLTRGLRR
jgi:AcrR family transcriptional regulator